MGFLCADFNDCFLYFQVLCSILAFGIRYQIAKLFYDV